MKHERDFGAGGIAIGLVIIPRQVDRFSQEHNKYKMGFDGEADHRWQRITRGVDLPCSVKRSVSRACLRQKDEKTGNSNVRL